MKIALCTVVIGGRYRELFDRYARFAMEDYCRRHGFSFFAFDRILSPLPGKSFSWQKLFLLDQSELSGFDRVIFVDSDILMASDAPSLVEGIPPGKLGFVREIPFDGNEESWFASFSLPPAQYIVQGGVLCLEHSHRDILREALSYPETGMYEMPAISHCISRSPVGHFIDARFNALVGTLMLKHVSKWILSRKPLKEMLWAVHYPPMRRALREICRDAWFVHAAGAKRDLVKAYHELRRTGRIPIRST